MADDSGLDPGLYHPLANPQPQSVAPPPVAAPPDAAPVPSGDVDPQFLAQLHSAAPSAQSATPPSGDGGVDTGLLHQLIAATSGAPTPDEGASGQPPHAPGAPNQPATHHQTRFQQAAAPTSTPEVTWGQALQTAVTHPRQAIQALGRVASGAAQSALPSAEGVIGSMWNAVTHPVQTLANVGQLGAGLTSQAADALGVPQYTPAVRAKNEALAKALEQHYAAYGTASGTARMVETDPVGVAMDASMVADPVAGVLGDVAKVGKLGALSDAAGVASKVLPYVNPIKSAMAIARAPGAIASKVMRGVGSVTSGVPTSALDLATQIGRDSDPVAQAAFTKFATGQGDATSVYQNAQQRLAQIRQGVSDQYMVDHANLADVQPSFDPIDQSIAAARSKIQMGGPEFQQAAGQFPEANAAVDQAESTINAYRNSPDPLHQSLNGVDNLKQALYDQASNYSSGSAANSALMGIYHGTKQALVDADSGYADLMDQYQTAKVGINDLTKTLGLGTNAAATGAVTKMLRQMKTGTGQNLLAQLMEGNPELRGALAGSAVNPWARGSMSIWEAALGAGLPGALVHPLAAAGVIPGAIAGLAASSPRVIGSAANLAGQIGGKLDALGSPLAQAGARGVYYAGRANEENGSNSTQDFGQSPSFPDAPASAASGAPMAPPGTPLSNMTYHQKVARFEGMNNPAQKNLSGSSAMGLGQFTEGTWLSMIQKYRPDLAAGKSRAQILALRTDPNISAQMIEQYGNENGQILSHSAIPVNDATKYGAAWFGADGFKTVYNAPDNMPMAVLAPHIGKYGLSKRGLAQNGLTNATVADAKATIERRMGMSLDGGPWQAASIRPGRASGGAVSDEALITALMSRAEKAKKAEDASTKPLLHVPDNAVAKALEIAGAAI
jgi:hypothetical protein